MVQKNKIVKINKRHTILDYTPLLSQCVFQEYFPSAKLVLHGVCLLKNLLCITTEIFRSTLEHDLVIKKT